MVIILAHKLDSWLLIKLIVVYTISVIVVIAILEWILKGIIVVCPSLLG